MKPIVLFFFVLVFPSISTFAQSSTDLTAQEIFEKVIRYYDPNGVWGKFSGSMHLYTIGPDWLGQEDLTIDNTTGFYQCVRTRPDGEYIKGVKNGEVFFSANGKELKSDQVPEKLQTNPYGLNEAGTRTFKEVHTTHFSLPLSYHAAGAKPLPEVSTETIFGAECLAIKFTGLPNAYEKGMFYNVPVTLYIDPANDYRLHAVYVDNGWWKDGKGVLWLIAASELEIGGLKVPARKLYFDAANQNFRVIDVFTTDTRF